MISKLKSWFLDQPADRVITAIFFVYFCVIMSIYAYTWQEMTHILH